MALGDGVMVRDEGRDDRRRKADADLRYGSGGLRDFERRTLAIVERNRGARVERTRDAIEVTLNQAPSLVLLATPEALEVRTPCEEFTAAEGRVPSSVLWKRVPWNELEDANVPALLAEARRVIATRPAGAATFTLEAHGAGLMEACRRLARDGRRTRDACVRLTFEDGILLLHMAPAEVGVPASGSWPGEVTLSPGFLSVFAAAPLDRDPITVAYEDGEVRIGPMTILATSAKEAS